MNIDFSNPLVIAAGVALAFVVGRLLFRFDTRVENRRREAFRVAARLTGWGMVKLPALLECYAIGDYSGVAGKSRELIEALSDPAQRHVEFAKLAKAIMLESLESHERRDATLRFLSETLDQYKDA